LRFEMVTVETVMITFGISGIGRRVFLCGFGESRYRLWRSFLGTSQLLIFATLAAMLLGGKAHAGDSGAVTLSVGETFSVRINGVYRDVRVCNNVGSAGDLVAIISRDDPVRLTPGACLSGHGDRVDLRNDSTGKVRAIYLVTGVHQS
jgi:hypothetical protein